MKSLRVTTQMKATEQYFPVVLHVYSANDGSLKCLNLCSLLFSVLLHEVKDISITEGFFFLSHRGHQERVKRKDGNQIWICFSLYEKQF